MKTRLLLGLLGGVLWVILSACVGGDNRPDLSVEIIEAYEAGCSADVCSVVVELRVHNIGGSDVTTAFEVRVSDGPDTIGEIIPIEDLDAGATLELTASLSSADSANGAGGCVQQGCEVRATISAPDVSEAETSNNSAATRIRAQESSG
jgi:hypothetical protein